MKVELSLDFIQIRYEDLINDIHGETDKLFTYLNISSDANVNQFHLHARNKIINTSSNAQVIQPLYQDAKYKWKN